MLINTVEGQECRIAILDGDRLEELYTERASSASQVGNIYKGRVTNIEPSIQAAFIDFGGIKNGFLHISDLHPKYFAKAKKATEQVGRRSSHRSRPQIQECLKRGQEIVVQMTKQGIGTKGPAMTTYLSIPGRVVVTMPGMTHVGISRKIEDEEVRAKVRAILDQLEIPEDMGVIVRTAGVDRTKRDMQRDLSYLSRLWKSIDERIEKSSTPAEIYRESDLVIRTIRDIYDSDIERIICDSEPVTIRVKEFLDVAVPRAKCKLKLYTGRKGLFEEFGVEDELEKIHSRRVELSNGGSLVIDQTEALVAIDVNSGSFRAHSNAEQNALQLNLAAADEIGRQLRLRDMGGVIVIDFVDMREEKNRRTLEKRIRDILKKDRAKSKVLKISSFGLIEMTRQRLRPSLKQSIYSRCPQCDGTGQIMSQESVALAVMRNLQVACTNEEVANIEIFVSPSVAHHLANTQRQHIAQLEKQTEKNIVITANPDLTGNDVNITCTNLRGSPVAWDSTSGQNKKSKKTELVDIKEILNGKRPLAEAEARADAEDNAGDIEMPLEAETVAEPDKPVKDKAEDEKSAKKSRRRGRRGGRKKKAKSTTPSAESPKKAEAEPEEQVTEPVDQPKVTPEEQPVKVDTLKEKPAESKTEKDKPEPKTAKRTKKTAKKIVTRKKAKSSAKAKNDQAKQDKPEEKTEQKDIPEDSTKQIEEPEKNDSSSSEDQAAAEKKKPRRRGSRGGRKHRKKKSEAESTQETAESNDNKSPKGDTPLFADQE